ncbi:MAG: hypothetical protein AB1651_18885 [Pseudomonadota bacterium]
MTAMWVAPGTNLMADVERIGDERRCAAARSPAARTPAGLSQMIH